MRPGRSRTTRSAGAPRPSAPSWRHSSQAGRADMALAKPKQWEPLAAIPIIAGLHWLIASASGGWLLWGLLPGALMLMSGMALLLLPGDLRITEYMAAGGFLGVLL